MTNIGPFVRRILESPDDDGPRLVLADWLEERGDTIRAGQLRRSGRWTLIQRWRAASPRSRVLKVQISGQVSILAWDDNGESPSAAIIGAIQPVIRCEAEEELPRLGDVVVGRILPTPAGGVQLPPFAAETARRPAILPGSIRVDSHYDTAATRVGGKWYCWGCATAWSRARTTAYVKALSHDKLGELVEVVIDLRGKDQKDNTE